MQICATHAVEMRCSKTGHFVELHAAGAPYQIWSGDEFTCPVGGERFVTNFPSLPVSEHWEDNYATFQRDVRTVVS